MILQYPWKDYIPRSISSPVRIPCDLFDRQKSSNPPPMKIPLKKRLRRVLFSLIYDIDITRYNIDSMLRSIYCRKNRIVRSMSESGRSGSTYGLPSGIRTLNVQVRAPRLSQYACVQWTLSWAALLAVSSKNHAGVRGGPKLLIPVPQMTSFM